MVDEQDIQEKIKQKVEEKVGKKKKPVIIPAVPIGRMAPIPGRTSPKIEVKPQRPLITEAEKSDAQSRALRMKEEIKSLELKKQNPAFAKEAERKLAEIHTKYDPEQLKAMGIEEPKRELSQEQIAAATQRLHKPTSQIQIKREVPKSLPQIPTLIPQVEEKAPTGTTIVTDTDVKEEIPKIVKPKRGKKLVERVEKAATIEELPEQVIQVETPRLQEQIIPKTPTEGRMYGSIISGDEPLPSKVGDMITLPDGSKVRLQSLKETLKDVRRELGVASVRDIIGSPSEIAASIKAGSVPGTPEYKVWSEVYRRLKSPYIGAGKAVVAGAKGAVGLTVGVVKKTGEVVSDIAGKVKHEFVEGGKEGTPEYEKWKARQDAMIGAAKKGAGLALTGLKTVGAGIGAAASGAMTGLGKVAAASGDYSPQIDYLKSKIDTLEREITDWDYRAVTAEDPDERARIETRVNELKLQVETYKSQLSDLYSRQRTSTGVRSIGKGSMDFWGLDSSKRRRYRDPLEALLGVDYDYGDRYDYEPRVKRDPFGMAISREPGSRRLTDSDLLFADFLKAGVRDEGTYLLGGSYMSPRLSPGSSSLLFPTLSAEPSRLLTSDLRSRVSPSYLSSAGLTIPSQKKPENFLSKSEIEYIGGDFRRLINARDTHYGVLTNQSQAHEFLIKSIEACRECSSIDKQKYIGSLNTMFPGTYTEYSLPDGSKARERRFEDGSVRQWKKMRKGVVGSEGERTTWSPVTTLKRPKGQQAYSSGLLGDIDFSPSRTEYADERTRQRRDVFGLTGVERVPTGLRADTGVKITSNVDALNQFLGIKTQSVGSQEQSTFDIPVEQAQIEVQEEPMSEETDLYKAKTKVKAKVKKALKKPKVDAYTRKTLSLFDIAIPKTNSIHNIGSNIPSIMGFQMPSMANEKPQAILGIKRGNNTNIFNLPIKVGYDNAVFKMPTCNKPNNSHICNAKNMVQKINNNMFGNLNTKSNLLTMDIRKTNMFDINMNGQNMLTMNTRPINVLNMMNMTSKNNMFSFEFNKTQNRLQQVKPKNKKEQKKIDRKAKSLEQMLQTEAAVNAHVRYKFKRFGGF